MEILRNLNFNFLKLITLFERAKAIVFFVDFRNPDHSVGIDMPYKDRVFNPFSEPMNPRKLIIICALSSSFLLSSCSKKPAELYNDGMKSFAAGNYEKAQENFADGIKKGVQTDSPGRSDSLYAGFVAANLATGKYALINAAYNDFTNGIHNSLVKMYGERAMKMVGITKEIIPYKTGGGNQLPSDFPQTVMIQEIADRQGFFTVKQQVNDIIKK